MFFTIRSTTKIKKPKGDSYLEKGILSNEQQLKLYRSGGLENLQKHLKDFYEKRCDVTEALPRHFYFVDSVQKEIIDDMQRGQNLSVLEEVIPYIQFTGDFLIRFIKSAPRELLVLYCEFNYIPRKNRNLLANRLGD